MAAGGMLLGGLVGAAGELERGENISKAEYLNAERARENARLTREQAVEEERRQRIVGKKALGDIRVTYGASGVQSNTGSALDVLEESARNAELDALTIRYQGELKAREYMFEAKQATTRGAAARREARIGAIGQIFGSAGRAAGSTAGSGGGK